MLFFQLLASLDDGDVGENSYGAEVCVCVSKLMKMTLRKFHVFVVPLQSSVASLACCHRPPLGEPWSCSSCQLAMFQYCCPSSVHLKKVSSFSTPFPSNIVVLHSHPLS